MNLQTPIARSPGNGGQLLVHSIFHTIQGEGPYSGHPAVFIRLGGCNLQCPGCDTEYTQGGLEWPVAAIIGRVQELFTAQETLKRPLVVITGGEPFRQNIIILAHQLLAFSHVQIETNGTMDPGDSFPEQVMVVVSPKAGKVVPSIAHRKNVTFKYVLDHRQMSTVDGLPLSALGSKVPPARPPHSYSGRIFLGPMDTGDAAYNLRNTSAAVASCLHFGYVLNLQVHKLVGLP